MFNEIDFRGIDPWAEAPSEEPLRQYYYMARIRAGIAPVSAAAGRPLTYHLETFGCQMNEKQSEVVAGILDEIGYERVHGEEAADVVLYNTCTVRENANLKVYGRLGRLRSIKKDRPDLRIVLFGCMMQEPEVVERIRRDYPFVNLVFGTHNLFQFAELFCGMLEQEGQLIDIREHPHTCHGEHLIEYTQCYEYGMFLCFAIVIYLICFVRACRAGSVGKCLFSPC